MGGTRGKHPGFGEGAREPGARFFKENLTFRNFSKISIFSTDEVDLDATPDFSILKQRT